MSGWRRSRRHPPDVASTSRPRRGSRRRVGVRPKSPNGAVVPRRPSSVSGSLRRASAWVGNFPDPDPEPDHEPYRQIIGSSHTGTICPAQEEVPVMSALITNQQSQTYTEGTEGGVARAPAEQFLAEAERARRLAAGQLVLTQSRCVDHLLDLLNLATEPAVRA